MSRVSIPDELAAKALFYSDRICCVCRVPKKPVQIHHVDENNSNNVLANLAVLCFDCHTETQVKGGFHRKLDAQQIKLYRDDWLEKIGRHTGERRTIGGDANPAPFVIEAGSPDSFEKHRRVESRLEELEATDALIDTALEFDHDGEVELRDKCIDKALLTGNVEVEDELFLRSLQGKVHLVNSEKIESQLMQWREDEEWRNLARAYSHLGRREESIECYCLTAIKALKEKRPFVAAFHLKEMAEDNLIIYLFERALQEAKEENDVWWQIRSLEELERRDEIDDLVLHNRELIESRGLQSEMEYLDLAMERKKETTKD